MAAKPSVIMAARAEVGRCIALQAGLALHMLVGRVLTAKVLMVVLETHITTAVAAVELVALGRTPPRQSVELAALAQSMT